MPLGKGGLEHTKAMAQAINDAGTVVEVLLDGSQRVIDGPDHFLRFFAFQPVADVNCLVSQNWPDVFL
jgi:hypothetical protein